MPAPAIDARPLTDLPIGQSAAITHLVGPPEIRMRLLEMGLTSGTTVRLVRVAPLGDPVELAVRGYRLSVRKSEAAAVMIESVG